MKENNGENVKVDIMEAGGAYEIFVDENNTSVYVSWTITNDVIRTDDENPYYFFYELWDNMTVRFTHPISQFGGSGCGVGNCGPCGETRLGEKRLSKITPEGTIYYFYDMDEDVYIEFNETGVVIARYVHGPGIDEPISMERGGLTYYYLFDGLGQCGCPDGRERRYCSAICVRRLGQCHR